MHIRRISEYNFSRDLCLNLVNIIFLKEVEDLNNKNAILIAQKMKLNEDVQELNEELERA